MSKTNLLSKLKAQLLAIKPSNVQGTDNEAYQMYWEYFYRLIKGRFKVSCPDDWNVDYMLQHLIEDGLLLITDTAAGIIPLKTGVSGDNIWNRPSSFITANHILGNIKGTIGVDGVCIYTNGDGYMSSVFLPLISKFAYLMASYDASIDVNLMNSRAAMIFDCATSKQESEAKAVYEKISRGEPAVFFSQDAGVRNGGRLEFHTINVSQTFIVDKLQDAKRTSLNEMLNMIGIKTSNTDKKERLVTDEVNSNLGEIAFNIAYINESLERGCRRAMALYPAIGHFSIKMEDDFAVYSKGIGREDGNDNSGDD